MKKKIFLMFLTMVAMPSVNALNQESLEKELTETVTKAVQKIIKTLAQASSTAQKDAEKNAEHAAQKALESQMTLQNSTPLAIPQTPTNRTTPQNKLPPP